MRDKIDEYFQYGTRQVWLVRPKQKRIEVHLPDGTMRSYGVGQAVPGGDLLPGFTLDVTKAFEV